MRFLISLALLLFAEIINPLVKVIAPFEGIVIGQALKAMYTQGDALYHIASFKKISGIRATLMNSEMKLFIKNKNK